MSNYSVLKQDINNNIYENQTQQITGTVLNAILNEMTASLGAGYQFAGVATLGMNPGDPDQRVFYLAGEGIYTNFGGIQVPAGKLGVLKWDNRWTLQTIDGLGGGGANLTGYVSVASTDDLPDEGQPTLGYLCGTNLYLYVGEGGDTKEGKYQDCGSFRGPQGDSVQDVEQTQTSLENGGVNKIKFTLSNGISCEFQVRNGTTSSGLFPTVAALQAAYPNPVVGQYAFVGAGFPADIYVCTTAGTWTDSGEDYDGDNVDLTDYATKAEVNQLEAKVDLEIDGVATIDKGIVWSNGYINGTTGTVTASSTSQFSQPVLLKAGEKLSYKTGTQYTKAVVKVADSSPVAVGDTLSGDTIISYDTANATVEYTATEDIYIVITVQISSNEITFTGYNSNSIQSQINAIKQKVDAVVTYTDTPTVNIFDKTAASEDEYVNRTNGSAVSYTGFYATDFIPVDSRGVYFNKGYSGGAAIGAAVYDSNKTFRRTADTDHSVVYQEGDAYVRFTVQAANVDTAMAVAGSAADVPSEYVPYRITYYSLNDDVVPFDAITFKTKQVGKNKLNKAEISDGQYINRNTGAVENWSANAATPFIPVSKKGLYFNKYLYGGVAIGAAVYDEQKYYLREATNPYIYQDGDGYVRYSLLMEDKDTAQVEEGTVGTSYEGYTEREVIDPNYLPDSENQGGEESSLQVFLPDKIHAVVGDTIQIFFKGIVKSVDALKYNVCIKCSKGSIYHRYWQYTPAVGDAGNYTFQVFVRDDNGETLGAATRTLVVSSAPSSPETVKSVVCVGSSESANGIWPAELGRRLVGIGGTPVADGITNVQLCGTKTKDGFGFVGNSGWSWVDYATKGRAAFRFSVGTTPNLAVGNRYSNNGYNYEIIEISDNGTILCETSSTSNIPQASGNLTKVSGSGDSVVPFTASAQDAANPFWDYANDKLTFIPFANAYCDGHIDALYFLAGTNGLTAFKTDFSNFETYMISFAETLHAEFPSAKLVLVSYCFPSMELMMPGYGANGGWADTYGMLTSLFNEQIFYQEFANRDDYSDFVDYVALAPEVDSDNNFPVTMKDVNTRNNTKQEPYANNTIHAGTFGYLQFADAVYRHFVAKFCQ